MNFSTGVGPEPNELPDEARVAHRLHAPPRGLRPGGKNPNRSGSVVVFKWAKLRVQSAPSVAVHACDSCSCEVLRRAPWESVAVDLRCPRYCSDRGRKRRALVLLNVCVLFRIPWQGITEAELDGSPIIQSLHVPAKAAAKAGSGGGGGGSWRFSGGASDEPDDKRFSFAVRTLSPSLSFSRSISLYCSYLLLC